MRWNSAVVAILMATILPACAEERHIAVISHRGYHTVHRENSLSAIQAALDAGADFVEVDVRTTSDGALVLLHDAKVDRVTNGTGVLAEKTFAEARALGIPTFEEALAVLKGRGSVYVDVKNARAEDVIAALEKAGMGGHAVIYSGIRFLAEIHQARPGWKVMPEAVNEASMERVIEELHPKVIAFDSRDFRDELIIRAKKAGALVYVDRLGEQDTPKAWEDAIRRGADGIQTDRPEELAGFFATKGWHSTKSPAKGDQTITK